MAELPLELLLLVLLLLLPLVALVGARGTTRSTKGGGEKRGCLAPLDLTLAGEESFVFVFTSTPTPPRTRVGDAEEGRVGD